MKMMAMILAILITLGPLTASEINPIKKKKNSYIVLTKALDNGKLKPGKKLTRSEKRVIKAFISGNKLRTRDLKHFESALVKHKNVRVKRNAPVFGRKKLHLIRFPEHNDIGNWYVLKPGKRKSKTVKSSRHNNKPKKKIDPDREQNK